MPTQGAALENRNYFKKIGWHSTSLEVSSHEVVVVMAKEGQIFQNPVLGHWVATVGSGTPPMRPSVFVSVFDMCLEFTRAPVMTSAAEFQETIRKISGRRPQ